MATYDEHEQEAIYNGCGHPEIPSVHSFTVYRDVIEFEGYYSCNECPCDYMKGNCATDSSLCEFAAKLTPTSVRCGWMKCLEEED